MTVPTLGRLFTVPAVTRPDLLGGSVATALATWRGAGEVGVVEIDPALADTTAMTVAYELPLNTSVNCVVVAGRRDGQERIAACLIRADTRLDNVVRRALDVRKASFLPADRAITLTGMEYGGITPIGLPEQWRVFVDATVVDLDIAVLGSGVRRSKLLLPGRLIADLPRAELVSGLAH
ncbi:MAG: YbaK/EbsC family protein [Nocardioidaceae bacterium]